MATVTGYTAEKIAELFGDEFISAEVSGDDLILHKRNGSTVDVGSVRGPQGDPGDPGADAAPGDVNPTAGTTPIRDSSGRVKGGTPSATNDLTTKGYVDAADSALAAQMAGTELGTQDLNTMTSSGLYVQTDDSEATSGTHYPVFVGGTLQVMSNASHGLVMQFYTAFSDPSTMWRRSYYSGGWSTWKKFTSPADPMPAPTTNNLVGADTSGTTESRDTILGNYTFTSIAGHSYRVVLENGHIVPDTLGDQFACRIRDGGASTPTSASTLIANSRVINVGVGKAHPVVLGGLFTPSAGVHTLSCFLVRMAGTGVAHYWSGDLARQLYVIDLTR